MTDGFKTCPFCGKEIKLKIAPTVFSAKVICDDCGVTMSRCYKTDPRVKRYIENLIREDWNRRATDVPD
ncbi:MAG: Lar family restriction alleviation protein [Clostridia bacterium]|nr:Lar family restriction alleviation protein [Clostridia bacterium]